MIKIIATVLLGASIFGIGAAPVAAQGLDFKLKKYKATIGASEYRVVDASKTTIGSLGIAKTVGIVKFRKEFDPQTLLPKISGVKGEIYTLSRQQWRELAGEISGEADLTEIEVAEIEATVEAKLGVKIEIQGEMNIAVAMVRIPDNILALKLVSDHYESAVKGNDEITINLFRKRNFRYISEIATLISYDASKQAEQQLNFTGDASAKVPNVADASVAIEAKLSNGSSQTLSVAGGMVFAYNMRRICWGGGKIIASRVDTIRIGNVRDCDTYEQSLK